MTPETREDLERQKLKAEIASANATARDLSRRDTSRPAFWIGVATAVVALVGVFLQAYLSKNEYVLARIQKERAELDARAAAAERDQLQTQQMVLRGELARLDAVIKSLVDRKLAAESEISKLEGIRAGLSAAVPNVPQSIRFAPVGSDKDRNEFLQDILDGWWRGTEIWAIHWVDQQDRRGWELTEGR